MDKEKKEKNQDLLILEYQTAQDSAHHHDNLGWTITAIIWSAMIVLLGFVLSSYKKGEFNLILITLSILGIVLTVSVCIVAFQMNNVKRQKYKRCREIEAIIDLEQHRNVKWPKRFLRSIYLVITILFTSIWIIVLTQVI